MFRFDVRAGIASVALLAASATTTRADEVCDSLVEVERLLAPAGELRLTDIVAISPDDIWAVGYAWTSQVRTTVTAHYDGNAWTILPSPSPGSSAGLNAVAAVAADDVWAAGDYVPSGASANDSLVLHWDGTSWTVVPSPGVSQFGEQGFSFAAIEAVGPDDVWFTGTRGDRASGAFTAHWNGTGFSVHPTPAVVNHWHEMVGLSALSASDVWGVGGTATIRSGGFVMRWNGSQWSTVLAPDFGGPQRYFEDVAAIALDDVWVTGIEKYLDGNIQRERPCFIHWDGSEWTEFATPGFAVRLKVFGPNDIYGISGDTLIHWDGAAWTVVDTLATTAILDNLVAIDGFDECSLRMVGQVELTTAGQLGGWIVGTAASLPGDLNGDGCVDFADLVTLLGAYGVSAGGDIDGDADTDFADLIALLGNYGSGNC